jgi:TolA-binding protein
MSVASSSILSNEALNQQDVNYLSMKSTQELLEFINELKSKHVSERKENEEKMYVLQTRVNDLQTILRQEKESKEELEKENLRLKEEVGVLKPMSQNTKISGRDGGKPVVTKPDTKVKDTKLVKDNNDKAPKRPAPEMNSNASKKPRVPTVSTIPVTRPPSKAKPNTTGVPPPQTTTTTATTTTLERKSSYTGLMSQRASLHNNTTKPLINTSTAGHTVPPVQTGTATATATATATTRGPRVTSTTTRPFPTGRKVDPKVNPSTSVGTTTNLTVPVKPSRVGRVTATAAVKPKPESKSDTRPPKNKQSVSANSVEQKTTSTLTKTPSISEMHAEVKMTEAADPVSPPSAHESPLPLENNVSVPVTPNVSVPATPTSEKKNIAISPQSIIPTETRIPIEVSETQEVESKTNTESEKIIENQIDVEPMDEPTYSLPSNQETSFTFDFDVKPTVTIESIDEKVNSTPTRIREKDFSNITPPPVNSLVDIYSPSLLDPTEEINYKINTNIYHKKEEDCFFTEVPVSKSSSPISTNQEKTESLPLITLPSKQIEDDILLTTTNYPETPKDYTIDTLSKESPKDHPTDTDNIYKDYNINNMDKQSPKHYTTDTYKEPPTDSMDIQKPDDNTSNLSVNPEEYTLYSVSPKAVRQNGILNSPILYSSASDDNYLDLLLPSPVPRSPNNKQRSKEEMDHMDFGSIPTFDDL